MVFYRKELFVCDCGDLEHQFVISSYGDNEIYLSILLDNMTFWSRLKYLFGFKSKYGAFGEIILNNTERKRLISVLTELDYSHK